MNRSTHTARTAGVGLITYGAGTLIAFILLGAPGGDYEAGLVPSYVARSHWPVAFTMAYVGAIAALGLLVFGCAARTLFPRSGDLLRGLSIGAMSVSVVGWFVDGGLVVSMAEGGRPVQEGTPDAVVYVITETGNLLAVCAPAFFMGVAAIVLATRAALPGWLRVFTVVAGICGILAPAFFTLFVFVLWTVVLGVRLAVSGDAVAGREGAAPELEAA